MSRTQRGFTLVEILVALSVAALLVSLVYGAVRIGQRSAQALGQQTEESEIMRIGWQFLHDAVSRARPLPDPADPANRTGFRGTEDQLQLIADMPAYVGTGGSMRIRLGSRTTIEGRQLILGRERIDQDAATPADGAIQEAVLVDQLDQLEIAYLGQSRRGQAAVWQSRWEHTRLLPNLVRIQVKPTHGRAWPVMIARTLSETSPLVQAEQPADDIPSPVEPGQETE